MANQNYLEWTDENRNTSRVEVVDRILIGRHCKGIDNSKRIIVDSPMVSRDHAVVKLERSGLQITDTSKNGTWINDVRMAAGSSEALANGDVIHVGRLLIRVFRHAPAFVDEEKNWLAQGETVIDSARIEVTNVVADVRGFSGMSQQEDCSLIYTFMKEIFGKFSAIVHDFKGTVKDYAGDAVFAYWHHDTSQAKERTVLACRAAIQQAHALDDIRTGLSDTNSEVKHLQMGWGITTGIVIQSHYGVEVPGLALVGDCINSAFRLSGIANKEVSDEIVICSRTADLVRDVLPLADLGSTTIRGRTGSVHIFGIKI